VFLILSFRVQTFVNGSYFAGQDKARTIWTLRLNQVLTASEIEEFSETPIQKSVSDYNRVRKIVGTVYGVLVVILIIFGGFQFYTAATMKASPSVGATNAKQGQSQTSTATGSTQTGSGAANTPGSPQKPAPVPNVPGATPP